MSTTLPPTDPWASTDHDPTAWNDSIEDHRATLLGALTDALRALARASAALTALSGPPVHDVEFTDAADACDVKAFLDGGTRYIRAAYAITHCIVDHKTA
jgi:hypothetical protein